MNIFDKVDTLLLTTAEDRIDENFYYLAGISKTKYVSATLIAKRNGRTVLTNRLEHGTFSGKKIIIENKKQFVNVVKKNSGKTVGMNFNYVSANGLRRYEKILKGTKIVDVSKELGEARAIKNGAEIKKIKEACRITLNVFDDIDRMLKKSRTERDLALEMRYAAIKNGAEDIAYPTIVAAGRNAALPHHASGNNKIIKGILLIDFGVIYDGYCSDITRTFSIGVPDKKAKHIYDIVYRAQQAGIGKMKSGSKSSEPHAASDAVLKNLGQQLIHAFGHGIGIQVHDYPGVLATKSNFMLNKNMVFTAEPGYYNRTWGGVRIEDDIVIGRGALTKAPKDLLIV